MLCVLQKLYSSLSLARDEVAASESKDMQNMCLPLLYEVIEGFLAWRKVNVEITRSNPSDSTVVCWIGLKGHPAVCNSFLLPVGVVHQTCQAPRFKRLAFFSRTIRGFGKLTKDLGCVSEVPEAYVITLDHGPVQRLRPGHKALW